MKRFGPGLLVAAAFIGPGTITTASLAGARFGFALVWALVFSVLATLVLQEMAARLGLATRAGLAQALRTSFRNPWLARAAILLVVAAIGLGNAAYQAGNITGAALGLAALTQVEGPVWALLVAGLAAALLASGRYRLVEGVLVALVALMSGVFLLTLLVAAPDWGALLAGLKPSLPAGALLPAIALVGTTVVPYNLFLHANAVLEKWPADLPLAQAIAESRRDTGLAISLGGLITLAIMATAASAFFHTGQVFSAATLANQLEPLLGAAAHYCFGIGLLAAGLTSAITAPLAAAYAVAGALQWGPRGFRAVWLAVLITGTGFAVAGTSPIAAILFAQAANGFLLPLVAVFLLWVMNRRELLGDQRNGPLANALGLGVVAVATGLGLYKLFGTLG